MSSRDRGSIPNEIARLMDEIRDLISLLLDIDADAMTRLEIMMHHLRVEDRLRQHLEEASLEAVVPPAPAAGAEPDWREADIPDFPPDVMDEPKKRIIH